MILAVLLLSGMFIKHVSAQQTLRFTEPHALVKQASKFLQQKNYQQAKSLLIRYLSKVTTMQPPASVTDIQTANYMMVLCNLKLELPYAEKQMQQFLDTTAFSQHKQTGNFQLARYYFNRSDFQKAIPCYEKSGIDFLTNKEISERNFELAYSYLVTQQLDKVDPLFASVKNIQGTYFTPGNYYHGLLAYYKGDYTEALTSFQKVSGEEKYKKIVPFYMAEIDYLRGDITKSETYAKELLERKERIYYHNELIQLLGQIAFEKENYPQAEQYLQTYLKDCESPRREDYFRLGYAQFQQAKFKEAIQNFDLILNSGDVFSQKAFYYKALALLSNRDKERAYEALLECIKIKSDEPLLKIASYNVGKLSYDRGDDEQAEKQLNAFIKSYPEADQANEATELLAYLHIKNKRFDDAVLEMNKLKTLSPALKKVYQKANYARGIQMLMSDDAERSFLYLDESNKYPVDQNIQLLASFWQSETLYRLGRYREALNYADYFLSNANGAYEGLIKNVHRLKGYCFLQQNDSISLQQEYPYFADSLMLTQNPIFAMGSSKPNYIPEKVPIVDNDPFILIYNLPDIAVEFNYTPVPLKPLAMNTRQEIQRFDHYALAAFGSSRALQLEAAVDLKSLTNLPIYVEVAHQSRSGAIKYQDYAETHLAVQAEDTFKSHRVFAGISIDKNKQYYYGYNHSLYNYDSVDIKQTFFNAGLTISAENISGPDQKLNYSPKLYTGIYQDRKGARESSVQLSLPVNYRIDTNTSVSLELLLDANSYNVRDVLSVHNSMLMIKPSVITSWEGVQIRAGLYPVIARRNYLLPDIHLQYPLFPGLSTVEAGWQSSLRLNTFRQISSVNPFIYPYMQVRQSRNTDIYVGVYGNFSRNCTYSGRVGVQAMNNLPLYFRDTTNDAAQFYVSFNQKALAFLLDASVDYTINQFNTVGARLHLRPLISTMGNQEPWHYIPMQLDVYGSLKVSPKIEVRTDLFLRAGGKTLASNAVVQNSYVRTISPGLDGNLGMKYHASPRWEGFIDVYNLFGSKYERWDGYTPYARQLLLGVIFQLDQNLKK